MGDYEQYKTLGTRKGCTASRLGRAKPHQGRKGFTAAHAHGLIQRGCRATLPFVGTYLVPVSYQLFKKHMREFQYYVICLGEIN